MLKGRAGRHDIEQIVQRLASQDWTFPEMKQLAGAAPGAGGGEGGGAEGAGRSRCGPTPWSGWWSCKGKVVAFLGVATREQVEELSRELERLARRIERGQQAPPAGEEGDEAVRAGLAGGVPMPDIQTLFKEAWSNALAGVNAAEQEAEKVLSRIADAAGLLARGRAPAGARVRRAARQPAARGGEGGGRRGPAAPPTASTSRAARTSRRCSAGSTRSPSGSDALDARGQGKGADLGRGPARQGPARGAGLRRRVGGGGAAAVRAGARGRARGGAARGRGRPDRSPPWPTRSTTGWRSGSRPSGPTCGSGSPSPSSARPRRPASIRCWSWR